MSTKTISATKLRNNLSDALSSLDGTEDVLVVTRRGKSEKAIINLDKLEDLLAANDPAYLADIAKARKEAKDGDTLPMDEVFGNL